MTKDEALKLALEALENIYYGEVSLDDQYTAITAIKEALAQPGESVEQEPFTYYRHYDDGLQDWPDKATIPLYTTPAKSKEWVSMEWEDIQKARQRCGSMVEAMQYINNWLKEKNHD